MRQGPWFAFDNLYVRYCTAARGGVGVGRGSSDSNAEANADEEGKAKEGGNMVEDE